MADDRQFHHRHDHAELLFGLGFARTRRRHHPLAVARFRRTRLQRRFGHRPGFGSPRTGDLDDDDRGLWPDRPVAPSSPHGSPGPRLTQATTAFEGARWRHRAPFAFTDFFPSPLP